MPLRPYQIDLINKVRESYIQGYKRPCIVLGCGGGKSFIVAEMARKTTEKGNRVLFLVHRQELVQQIFKTFFDWGVNMDLCKIGMVQTITRRIQKIPKPSLIITDENHHCLANSYRRIYDYFSDVRCVGVTATPIRLNGSGLGDINDKLVIGVSTKWLIKNGYLAPFDYYAPSLIDTDHIHIKNGDYNKNEVEGLFKKAIYGDVIANYIKLADGKQAICYCATVKHSEYMADEFNQAGITARHIDGKTDKRVRAKIIDDFRAGKIKILCNVDLISEGFDVPDCEASILLRPTKSLTLYIQQSMRCMRYKPGKTAIIIDHVGNYARHGLPDEDREWDLTAKKSSHSKKNETEFKVRQCPKCFFTFPSQDENGQTINICPHCGHEFTTERTVQEIKDAKLEKIQGFVLNYETPEECGSMIELREYAKRHGYKPGWAYYQAKQRGII